MISGLVQRGGAMGCLWYSGWAGGSVQHNKALQRCGGRVGGLWVIAALTRNPIHPSTWGSELSTALLYSYFPAPVLNGHHNNLTTHMSVTLGQALILIQISQNRDPAYLCTEKNKHEYHPTRKIKTKWKKNERVILSQLQKKSRRQPILHHNVHIRNMPLRRG